MAEIAILGPAWHVLVGSGTFGAAAACSFVVMCCLSWRHWVASSSSRLSAARQLALTVLYGTALVASIIAYKLAFGGSESGSERASSGARAGIVIAAVLGLWILETSARQRSLVVWGLKLVLSPKQGMRAIQGFLNTKFAENPRRVKSK